MPNPEILSFINVNEISGMKVENLSLFEIDLTIYFQRDTNEDNLHGLVAHVDPELDQICASRSFGRNTVATGFNRHCCLCMFQWKASKLAKPTLRTVEWNRYSYLMI